MNQFDSYCLYNKLWPFCNNFARDSVSKALGYKFDVKKTFNILTLNNPFEHGSNYLGAIHTGPFGDPQYRG